MPNSGPPWVRQMEVVVVVENEPVPEQPGTEYAIDSFGYYKGSAGTYQELKKWTITTDRIGVLRSVELDTDHYDVAQFRITVKGTTVLEDRKIPTPFSKEWPDIKLSEAQEVLVEVKSDGSTTIKAWCDLNGKEVG